MPGRPPGGHQSKKERLLQRREGPFGLPDDACTTDIDVQDFWTTKQEATLCHASQLNPDSVLALLPPEEMRELLTCECFQLAESIVGGEEGSHDLFSGLR